MGERMTATVSLSEVAEPASALSLRDVQHTFAANKVVKGIDLDIAQGEVVCLLGPSGCGKTTLLRIAAGLEVVQEGTVSLEGQAIAAPANAMCRRKSATSGWRFRIQRFSPP
ncbi:hypothetical protein HAALTHF_18470n [Vreelandella aquamarina]|nr:hypothetical protein HAALTHF_18470n [Halomonas axialensis]